jgi:hypothetical protein
VRSHRSAAALDLQGDTKHTLIFTTERLQFVAMVYDEAGKALKTVATGDLRDRIGRQIERGQLFAVDPLSRVLALQFYEGHLKVCAASRLRRGSRWQRATLPVVWPGWIKAFARARWRASACRALNADAEGDCSGCASGH